MKFIEHQHAGRSKTLLALGWGVLFGILYFVPVKELLLFVLHPDNRRYNSHIVFIPIVCGYLLYGKRKEIFENEMYSANVGVPLLLVALILYILGGRESIVPEPTNRISLQMASSVLFTVGGFITIFGVKAFRFARFPLLFLFFVVPMPTVLMEGTLYILQVCSTEVSYLLFKLSGIPIFREGFVFFLPGTSIVIAKACSGMRATITLFILTVLAGHLFLHSNIRKLALVLSTFPITIFGNSARIFGLTLLALYVDKAYIDGESLPHLRGGWLFFLVDLAISAGVIALLKRGDKPA